MRDKASEELSISRQFAATHRPDIDGTSICPGDDPPDIVCQSRDFGRIAFELTRVEENTIYRGVAKAQSGKDGGGSYDEVQPICETVEKKLKHYAANAFDAYDGAELLAYRLYLPEWPQDFAPKWGAEVRQTIEPLLGGSAFRRVWVFGAKDSTLVLPIDRPDAEDRPPLGR